MFLQVYGAKDVYLDLRENVDTNFAQVYEQAVEKAESVGVAASKPRVVGRQANKSNNQSTSIEQHYRVNMAIPFLDHVTKSLDAKFDRQCTIL